MLTKHVFRTVLNQIWYASQSCVVCEGLFLAKPKPLHKQSGVFQAFPPSWGFDFPQHKVSEVYFFCPHQCNDVAKSNYVRPFYGRLNIRHGGEECHTQVLRPCLRL